MDDRAPSSYRTLLRELFWTRSGLLVSVTALIGVTLLALSSALTMGSATSRVAFALGTGLLAAAVFTSAQTLIATTAANRVLAETLADQTRRAMRELTDEYRAANATYLPTHVFDASSQPDPVLNRQLTRDLKNSQSYLFRGLSGRHTAVRLLTAPSRHWEVRVVADLHADESLYERARYLVGAGYASALDQTYATIRQQVRCGLVGLYLARIRCRSIAVTVSRSPSLDRFEIFDDSVWVTLYSDVSAPPAMFPRTLRFGRDSFIYTMQRRDFQRSTDEAPTETIGPAMTDDDFRSLYQRLTGERITARDLADLQEDFDRFRKDFVAEARLDRHASG